MKMKMMFCAGFAVAALASAAAPALAWTVSPDIDFEWYAHVGRPAPADVSVVEIAPAPREGHIWVAGRWEARGGREDWVAGHWIKDDYQQQVVIYNNPSITTTYATAPYLLRDSPEAYPAASPLR
jgi:WXXGXW repeat (2 copies)